MIVITKLVEAPRVVCPGDEFHMTITDGLNCKILISEIITVYKTLDFIASYRFALEDGTCPGFHLCGIFANKTELPIEMRNAVLLEGLTPEQYANFVRTVGIKIEK